MVHHNRRRTLLWLQQISCRQPHTNVLFRMQQCEEFRLIFKIRASWITEAISRSTVLLMKKIADVRRIVIRDSQLRPHQLVVIFGERFGGFHAESVQVEIFRVFPGFEQALRFLAGVP